jgi:hypothetical protein
MPQLTPLVLKDQKSPRVDHTFNPRGIDGGVTTLVESAGIPLGESRITFSQTRQTTGRVRALVKLAIPVVQDSTVNGITKPTVVRTSYVDMTFNFDGSSSMQERKDIVAFVNELTLATNSPVQAYLVNLEGFY